MVETIIEGTEKEKDVWAIFCIGLFIGALVMCVAFVVINSHNESNLDNKQDTYDNVDLEIKYSTITNKIYVPATPDNNGCFFVMANGDILAVAQTNYEQFNIGQGYVYRDNFIVGHT